MLLIQFITFFCGWNGVCPHPVAQSLLYANLVPACHKKKGHRNLYLRRPSKVFWIFLLGDFCCPIIGIVEF